MEDSTHDTFTPELFAGHLLNEGLEIRSRHVAADAGEAARQIIAQATLPALRIERAHAENCFPRISNDLMCV